MSFEQKSGENNARPGLSILSCRQSRIVSTGNNRFWNLFARRIITSILVKERGQRKGLAVARSIESNQSGSLLGELLSGLLKGGERADNGGSPYGRVSTLSKL